VALSPAIRLNHVQDGPNFILHPLHERWDNVSADDGE
jgi:hypothetical protein